MVSQTSSVSRECSPLQSVDHLQRRLTDSASPRPYGSLTDIEVGSSPPEVSPATGKPLPVLHTTKDFTASSALRSGLVKGISTLGETSSSASTHLSEGASTFAETSSSASSSRPGSLISESSALAAAIRSAIANADPEPLPKPPTAAPPLRDISFSRLMLRRHLGAIANSTNIVHEERSIKALGETKIYDLYHWDQVIQEAGDGGKVVVCRPKCSKDGPSVEEGEEFVMKIFKKHSINEEKEAQFRKVQHRMLNFPPHSGVMPLHEVLEDDSFYYTVMEKAEGGPLFQSLVDAFPDGVIPAAAVKRVMKHILGALAHVHKNGMLHRDIKPDNIVVHNGCPTLIDFDHADPDWNASEHKRVNSFFGTVRFSAPEAFRGYFSQQSDLYSVGVLLYLLMTGKLPRDDRIMEAIAEAEGRQWSEEIYMKVFYEDAVDWQCDPWPENYACRHFCQRLLHFFPQARPNSADEALAHPWLARESELSN